MNNKLLLLFLVFTIKVLSQSGTLDTSFGINGKVHTGFGLNNSMANAVAVQPDGKIIVGGSAYSANTVNSWERDANNAVLVRYNADGSRDTSFGTEGLVMNDYYTFANAQGWSSDVLNIKVLADGKILTYGSAILGYTGDTELIRYNSNGSVDTSFGTNGHIRCSSSPIGGADSLLIQPDGKLVVIGVQVLQPTTGVYISNFILQRFTAEGIPDASFGTDGVVITSFGFGYNTPRAIALQSDGKILAVGASFNNQFALARYTVNGQLDTTFDGDGKVTTSFGTGIINWPNFVSVHADGKILVAGITWNSTGTTVTNFSLARYNTNGSLDTSFDSDGKATTPFAAGDLSLIITSVLEQPDGKLLVTTTETPNSYTYGMTDNFITRRYNPDATPDATFGINGKVSTACQEGYNRSKMAAIQPDGKILVAGFSHVSLSEQNDFNVVRYEPNGTLDTSFDWDGKVFTSFDSSNDEIAVFLRQPDNKLIAIGTKRNAPANQNGTKDIALSRYNSDGSLDNSFGTSGKVVSVFGTNYNAVSHAIIQPDGKIILANTYYSFFGDVYHYELIRYTASGSLDVSFGTGGKIVLDAEVTSLLSQPDGKFVTTAIGYDSQDNLFLIVKRFNANGTLDTGFGTNGTTSLQGSLYNTIHTILQPDGKIIISTSLANNNSVTGFATFRFNANGSLDTDFQTGITNVDTSCLAKAVFLQTDGKIIVAGRSMAYEGFEIYYFVTARYNPDGSPDTTYGTNGILKSYIGTYWTPYNLVQAVVLQPDGKFVVAMTKPEQNPSSPTPNSYDFSIIRFDAAGNYDNDFGGSGQITTNLYNKYDEAFAMILLPDNKIIVAGTTDTGINRDFAMARYNNIVELGVADFTPNTDLILYPNPVNDILHIKTKEDLEIMNYSIYNMLGQMVYKDSGANLEIPTANFSKGIYNLSINTNKGSVSKKFIKE